MSGQEKSPCHILVMASGFGSNFQALIDAVDEGKTIRNSQIIRLVTNRKNAYATTRAENAGKMSPCLSGIPWDYFNLISHGFLLKGEKDEQKIAEARERYDAALAERVLSADDKPPELIVLAGWMHIFSKEFLEPMEKAGARIINLHPALPGEFDGANAIERAYEELTAGRLTRTGIMAHYVIKEVDRGTPIVVEEIEWKGETLEELKDKIHSCEHKLIVDATAKVVEEILEGRAKET
ncbi:phosphoribosylglycinamide formyltransferase [Metarhizium guizhouense ARSEF 977]|uniref:phosphoribosylglycinamide formyltransferase 1 n=1 Tax=Metarhizium guizhouense (strain ARSEF 977) TaxID=1276136 RepID=A0A0B4H926_METGA|nr:phosphoribosylglycinamide formyltransferase [Metarhizium guizhouense ARSEF 977]